MMKIIIPHRLMRRNVMIEIKSVSKRYDCGEKSCIALNQLTVDIQEGIFTAITGKSGSGKTTLLNMIGLIDKPDSGEIWVRDKNIAKLKKKEVLCYRRETVGIVFQFFQLIQSLNCRENIMIANEYAKRYEQSYFDELIEALNISNLMKKYPSQLSGGEQQRVAIARALINRPQILLADEPTGNLDSENGAGVIRLLRKLSKEMGLTLLVVTHDEDIAKQADQTIRLVDGCLERQES